MYQEKTVTVVCPACGKSRQVPEVDNRVHEDWKDGGYCSKECSETDRGEFHKIKW